MLSLSQLLILTQNEKRRFRTEYRVDALALKAGVDNFGSFTQFSAILIGGKEPRQSVIRLYSEEVKPEAPTKVTCSCTYFRVHLAVALYLAGSTNMKVARADIPEKLRDLQKPGLCPHLHKLAESLLTMSSTEMKRLKKTAGKQNVNARLRRLT